MNQPSRYSHKPLVYLMPPNCCKTESYSNQQGHHDVKGLQPAWKNWTEQAVRSLRRVPMRSLTNIDLNEVTSIAFSCATESAISRYRSSTSACLSSLAWPCSFAITCRDSSRRSWYSSHLGLSVTIKLSTRMGTMKTLQTA